jgi:hypothetical protein
MLNKISPNYVINTAAIADNILMSYGNPENLLKLAKKLYLRIMSKPPVFLKSPIYSGVISM